MLVHEQCLRRQIYLLKLLRSHGFTQVPKSLIGQFSDRKNSQKRQTSFSGPLTFVIFGSLLFVIVKPEISLAVPHHSTSSDAKIDLNVVAGGSLLSAREGQACVQLGIIPQHYMTIKQILLAAAASRGFLRCLTYYCFSLSLLIFLL